MADYLGTTHGDTHHITMKPKNVFRLSREGEAENEERMKEIGNR